MEMRENCCNVHVRHLRSIGTLRHAQHLHWNVFMLDSIYSYLFALIHVQRQIPDQLDIHRLICSLMDTVFYALLLRLRQEQLP